jgi:muramoyltetrapeptide carboxypeptidase LdcA involved in peptidoglycan recycling
MSFLHPGNTIALITPAAGVHEEAVHILINLIEKAGLVPLYFKDMNTPETGPYAGGDYSMPYGSSDKRRLEGFQEALNSQAKVLWVLHGGQGCEKIVDALERGKLVLPADKKIIIGFSGVTNLHLYFLKQGWPCFHGPVGTIGQETAAITQSPINAQTSLQKVLDILSGISKALSYSLQPLNELARQSPPFEANVVGGCLNILSVHMGTPTALEGERNIILIEEQPERPEWVETRLLGLMRSGAFVRAKAILFGSFLDPACEEGRFQSIRPLLLQRIVELFTEHNPRLPLFYTPNFGHGPLNELLPLGIPVSIQGGERAFLNVDLTEVYRG